MSYWCDLEVTVVDQHFLWWFTTAPFVKNYYVVRWSLKDKYTIIQNIEKSS